MSTLAFETEKAELAKRLEIEKITKLYRDLHIKYHHSTYYGCFISLILPLSEWDVLEMKHLCNVYSKNPECGIFITHGHDGNILRISTSMNLWTSILTRNKSLWPEEVELRYNIWSKGYPPESTQRDMDTCKQFIKRQLRR